MSAVESSVFSCPVLRPAARRRRSNGPSTINPAFKGRDIRPGGPAHSAILDYEIFAKVIDAGSLSAAGRELQLSTTSISKRLRKLEERLGSRLIQRTTRRLALTEIGQGFYQRAVAALTAFEEAETFASDRSSAAGGLLRISAPIGFGRSHIAPHLKPFLDANPKLTLELDLSDEFVDLVGGGFDVAVRIASLNDSSLIVRRLAANDQLLCASPAYLKSHGEPQNVEELSRHQLLATSSSTNWQLHCRDIVFPFHVQSAVRTNSGELIKQATLAGIGIALRPAWEVVSELKAGTLQRVLRDYGSAKDSAIYAVYPSRRLLAAKVRAFVEYMANLLGKESN
jgi:DNA-binding transcriptional LysR family regulator